jgi:hypothetical protein
MGPISGRIVLTGPVEFYIDAVAGDDANDGGPDHPMKTLQAVASRLYTGYDLGGQTVTCWLTPGQPHAGLGLYGAFIGQLAPSSFLITCQQALPSNPAQFTQGAYIQPTAHHAGLEIAYGAMCRIERVSIDLARAASQGQQQDAIMIGQRAQVQIGPGGVRIWQAHHEANYISIAEQAILDVYGNIYLGGWAQCFIATDMYSAVNFVNNGQPNMLAIFLEYADGYRYRPLWTTCFLDASASTIVIQAIDFHGVADGYAYRVRKGGVIDVDETTNPGRSSLLPGSAATAWPVQGYGHVV